MKEPYIYFRRNINVCINCIDENVAGSEELCMLAIVSRRF